MRFLLFLLLGIVLITNIASAAWPSKCAPLFTTKFSTKEFPESIVKIFNRIEIAKYKSSIHPDKVHASDIDKAPIDTVVYLDLTKVKILPAAISQTMKFTVSATAPHAITLFNPQYGEFKFTPDTIASLYGNLYLKKNFRQRSVFTPGEFVQIGFPGERYLTQDIRFINLDHGVIATMKKGSPPRVAKFIRVWDEKLCEVEFNIPQSGSYRFLVDQSNLYQMPVGAGRTLQEMLTPLSDIIPQFSLHEVVRFRDGEGKMRQGSVVQIKGNDLLIQIFQDRFWISNTQVFSFWGTTTPTSISVDTTRYYYEPSVHINLGQPTGILKKFLDGAARLSSHPDFLSASAQTKLKILVTYQGLFLPWSLAGLSLEESGVENFSEILCIGAGVCRHQTPLMAAILDEAGLRVRIYYRLMKLLDNIADFDGHTWLEIDYPTLNGYETFVVDPSSADVRPLREVVAVAKKNPTSSEARYLAYPKRKLLETTAL